MTIASAINFALAALNLGVMIWSLSRGGGGWISSLVAVVFCFCIGIVCLRK